MPRLDNRLTRNLNCWLPSTRQVQGPDGLHTIVLLLLVSEVMSLMVLWTSGFDVLSPRYWLAIGATVIDAPASLPVYFTAAFAWSITAPLAVVFALVRNVIKH